MGSKDIQRPSQVKVALNIFPNCSLKDISPYFTPYQPAFMCTILITKLFAKLQLCSVDTEQA